MSTKSFHQSGKLKLMLAFLLTGGIISTVLASSHREAPLITGDPKVDATDMFAFVSPDKSDTVTLIANYLPFEEPSGGPNFYRFDDDALYEIKVDNDGDATPDITYQWRFDTAVRNPNTFLYNTGPVESLNDEDLNIRQTYTLTRVQDGQSTVIGENIPVAPSNVGRKSMPDYAKLQSEAVKNFNGITAFAGQSDDPFFVELGGVFDLLTIQLPGDKDKINPTDRLAGYNVQSLALQVPISQLTNSGAKPNDAKDPASILGFWTTASRQSTTVLGGNGTESASGDLVQVSRLGNPLVNEVVVPIAAKDLFNSSQPANDAQFADGVTNPELAKLLNKLYEIKVPPQGPFGTPEARDDLVAIYLTGIPDLTKVPNGTPSEQLRLNVAVPPSENPNRLGVLAKDNAGFPNGRRLTDDVTDISLQAVAGAAYPLFHPDFQPDPKAAQLTDGIDSNDKQFRSTFPYLALPTSGTATAEERSGAGASMFKDSSGVSMSSVLLIALGALLAGALAGGLVKRKA